MEHRIFIRLIGALILLSVIATAFHSSQKRVESTIDDAFKETIERDYQHRKSYLTRHSTHKFKAEVQNYALAPSVNRRINSYSIQTQMGTTIYRFKDSINEENAKRLLNQYLLELSHPIHPKQLKTFFQECLSKKGIDGSIGVLCIRNNTRQWSEADSIVPTTAYSTPRHTLDITGHLKVQAWADYPWVILVKHLDPVVYVLLLFITGVLLWIWPTHKKKEVETETIAPHGILIDMEKQEMSIDGKPCIIARLDLTILQMLHERKGECITREELKQLFWPTDDNAGEKIDTHIKTIRKTLKEFPQYQIVTVRGKGYYLQTPR